MNNINAKKAFLSKLQNYKKFFYTIQVFPEIFASMRFLYQYLLLIAL